MPCCTPRTTYSSASSSFSSIDRPREPTQGTQHFGWLSVDLSLLIGSMPTFGVRADGQVPNLFIRRPTSGRWAAPLIDVAIIQSDGVRSGRLLHWRPLQPGYWHVCVPPVRDSNRLGDLGSLALVTSWVKYRFWDRSVSFACLLFSHLAFKILHVLSIWVRLQFFPLSPFLRYFADLVCSVITLSLSICRRSLNRLFSSLLFYVPVSLAISFFCFCLSLSHSLSLTLILSYFLYLSRPLSYFADQEYLFHSVNLSNWRISFNSTFSLSFYLSLSLSACISPSLSLSLSLSCTHSLNLSLSLYIYIYIYICVCVCVCVWQFFRCRSKKRKSRYFKMN